MNRDLTLSERLTLYALIDVGDKYDDDTTEDRVLINRGFAERYSHPQTGHTMMRVTKAGRTRALPSTQSGSAAE